MMKIMANNKTINPINMDRMQNYCVIWRKNIYDNKFLCLFKKL